MIPEYQYRNFDPLRVLTKIYPSTVLQYSSKSTRVPSQHLLYVCGVCQSPNSILLADILRSLITKTFDSLCYFYVIIVRDPHGRVNVLLPMYRANRYERTNNEAHYRTEMAYNFAMLSNDYYLHQLLIICCYPFHQLFS